MSSAVEQREKIRLAVLAAARAHFSAMQDAHVFWEDGASRFGSPTGEVRLVDASALCEQTRADDNPSATPGVLDRKHVEVWRVNIDLQFYHPQASKSFDLAARIRNGLTRHDIRLDPLDATCRLVGSVGPLIRSTRTNNGRREPIWSFELPMRFSTDYTEAIEDPISVEQLPTIGAVEVEATAADEFEDELITVEEPEE